MDSYKVVSFVYENFGDDNDMSLMFLKTIPKDELKKNIEKKNWNKYLNTKMKEFIRMLIAYENSRRRF